LLALCLASASPRRIPNTYGALFLRHLDRHPVLHQAENRKGNCRRHRARNYLNQPVGVIGTGATGRFADGLRPIFSSMNPAASTFDPFPCTRWAVCDTDPAQALGLYRTGNVNYKQIAEQVYLARPMPARSCRNWVTPRRHHLTRTTPIMGKRFDYNKT